ncbi:hypothetical protein PCANC_02869 [Puccinia coronata f. sp. avenae]|uniref:Uncharacterized protein n=1 Tax=Puccinia coronata f. sp. avenae TaxID=200324 RepID=A0A2N5W417_9BASI|nr:hypothetical protein PCANC_02869 [Puccinia coronata f. sp. avenae]
MWRFVLEATIGRFKKASSGHYLTEAPTGCFYEASSGRISQVAPTGRFLVASSGRFCQVAPTGRFLVASSGRFCQVATVGRFQKAFSGIPLDALVPSGSHCPAGALKHLGCVEGALLKHLLDTFTRKRPADWQVFSRNLPHGLLGPLSKELLLPRFGAMSGVAAGN